MPLWPPAGLQWDSLLWQVPALSLAGQAFLFSVSLSPDTSSPARRIAAGLSVVVAVLTSQLMVRQRMVELADSEWLEKLENKIQSPFSGGDDCTVAGSWKDVEASQVKILE